MKYIFAKKISCKHENRRGRIELPSRPVLAPRLYVWQLRINSKNPYLYCEFSLVLHKSQKPEVNSKRSHEQEWANKVPQAGHYLLVFFFFNQARQTSVQCSNYLMKFFLLSYAAVHWLHWSFYFIMVTHHFGQIWSNTQSILDAKKVGDLCSIALNPSAKITVKKGWHCSFNRARRIMRESRTAETF